MDKKWWNNYSSRSHVVSSIAVINELQNGEHHNKDEKINFMSNVELLPLVEEIRQIVKIYIRRKMMPNNHLGDALHLAIASFYKCDVLLSWNCRHLVNFRKFHQIRIINVELGLFVPQLLTPLELVGDE